MRHLSIPKFSPSRALLPVAVVLTLMLMQFGTVTAQDAGLLPVDGFEADEEGDVPSRWGRLEGRNVVPLDPMIREAGEYYAVLSEEDRKFVRLRVEDESVRLVMPNGAGLNWNLETHPVLAWQWRVNELPPNAREDRRNDTAGAVYVTFSFNWLGRPRSIKYTYSSTLPVGTVVKQGPLKVVVVGSGEGQLGEWIHVERNVVEDYVRLFGGHPPAQPISIALWSDSDTTDSIAEVDFDELVLLARPH